MSRLFLTPSGNYGPQSKGPGNVLRLRQRLSRPRNCTYTYLFKKVSQWQASAQISRGYRSEAGDAIVDAFSGRKIDGTAKGSQLTWAILTCSIRV
jgi:hypothetical protein